MILATAHPSIMRPAVEATDEDLLLRYRGRHDIEAFEELVHRYQKPLSDYLLRYLHSVSLAEDVFQRTFLRLHEKCHLFNKYLRVRPWIYGIATHLAIDVLRREGRYRTFSLDQKYGDAETDIESLVKLLRSKTPSPLEQLVTKEQADWVKRAIDSLADPLRRIVLLAYMQGLTLPEVAELLHLPLGTVKSRLHRALVALGAQSQHAEVDARRDRRLCPSRTHCEPFGALPHTAGRIVASDPKRSLGQKKGRLPSRRRS